MEGKNPSSTLYYANFNLFADDSQELFLRYNTFKRELSNFLGPEWNIYAKKALRSADGREFIDPEVLFATALEVWLDMRKKLNSGFTAMPDGEKSTLNFQDFCAQVKTRFADFEENPKAWNAVIEGFFISAEKVWSHFMSGKPTSGSRLHTTDLEELEVKKEGGFLESIRQLSRSGESKFLIKPLWIVTEKLLNYLEKEKPSTEELVEFPPEKHVETEEEQRNLQNFKDNMEMESKDILRHKLRKLTLEESTASAEEVSNDTISMRSDESHHFLEVKKLKAKEGFISTGTIQKVYKYIAPYVESPGQKLQITAYFVTKITEVNYNNFLIKYGKKLVRNSRDLSNNILIRFIQPAQEFYHNLMEMWIISYLVNLKNEILFEEFIQKTKALLGEKWDEKFVQPTHMFFRTVMREWSFIRTERTEFNEKVRKLIGLVRNRLLQIWDQHVVGKSKGINNKLLPIGDDM